MVLTLSFQFHKGTIRTLAPQRAFHSNFYFNSIKVRLEHFIFHLKPMFILDFNSIKVRLELNGGAFVVCANLYFNSIKVRLERLIAHILI